MMARRTAMHAQATVVATLAFLVSALASPSGRATASREFVPSVTTPTDVLDVIQLNGGVFGGVSPRLDRAAATPLQNYQVAGASLALEARASINETFANGGLGNVFASIEGSGGPQPILGGVYNLETSFLLLFNIICPSDVGCGSPMIASLITDRNGSVGTFIIEDTSTPPSPEICAGQCLGAVAAVNVAVWEELEVRGMITRTISQNASADTLNIRVSELPIQSTLAVTFQTTPRLACGDLETICTDLEVSSISGLNGSCLVNPDCLGGPLEGARMHFLPDPSDYLLDGFSGIYSTWSAANLAIAARGDLGVWNPHGPPSSTITFILAASTAAGAFLLTARELAHHRKGTRDRKSVTRIAAVWAFPLGLAILEGFALGFGVVSEYALSSWSGIHFAAYSHVRQLPGFDPEADINPAALLSVLLTSSEFTRGETLLVEYTVALALYITLLFSVLITFSCMSVHQTRNLIGGVTASGTLESGSETEACGSGLHETVQLEKRSF